MLFFKKNSWLLVNLLLATLTAFFSISFMKIFLSVTSFLNCLRCKLLWTRNQVWANSSIFFFHFSLLFSSYFHLLFTSPFLYFWLTTLIIPGQLPTITLALLPCHITTPLSDLEGSSQSFQQFINSNPLLPMTAMRTMTSDDTYWIFNYLS